MSRAAIRKLKNLSYGEFRGEATKDCILSIFECHHIPNLVHIESSAALTKHQLNPSTLIHPDQTYDPLQHAADSIRADNKQGIVYLSARHSEGIAIALFGDHGGAIKALTATVRVRLSLISEDRTLKVEDKYFDPTRMRVSHSVGHFMIDAADFSRCEYLLQPILTSTHGYLDFFRIHYKGRYPQTAVSIR